MAVKLRLQRKGRSKAPFIVAADARAPRDGRFIKKSVLTTHLLFLQPLKSTATVPITG